MNVPSRAYGLYIHVPFCASICSYCHFSRTAHHHHADRQDFVNGIRTELDLRLAACPILTAGSRNLATVYIGGGTPSQLEADLMTRLIAGTVDRLPTAPDLEFTVEANPESLDRTLAEAWRLAGVNRISLGVQSLEPDVLQLLGRSCAPDTARRALRLATEIFPRVSADWIIGPGLEKDRFLAELDEAVDLGVTHFSLYILEVTPGTPLAAEVASGRVILPADRQIEALYLAAGDRLEMHGIRQYEVANFARPGHESRHNQGYWQGRPWLALGPSAHGYWGRRRYANHETLAGWLGALAAGELPVASVDPLDPASRRLERAVLALRTRVGLPLDRVPRGAFDLERGRREGLWELRDGRLVLTRRGFLRLDSLEERLADRL